MTKIKLESIKRCRPIPATAADTKRLDQLILKLQLAYQPVTMPGLYVSAKSNIGPLAFMLDTTADLPEKVKATLDQYKPILQEAENETPDRN